MIYWVVFILSASSLAFEVLLARIFSISQWNHLSFMVISIALFGFGASGTFLSLLDARRPEWEQRFSRRSFLLKLVIFYSVSAVIAFGGLNRLPIDYFRLPLEPIQMLYLLIAYLLLSIPFFFTGMIMSIGFAALPDKTGLVYCASMTGSALGAVMPALGLGTLGEGYMVLSAALIPLFLPLFGDLKRREGMWTALWAVVTLSVLSGGIYYAGILDDLKWIRPSPYKALSQVLQFPNTEVTDTRSGLRGRIDRVQSPYIRFAPGLSLKFTGALPRQWAVYRDGDRPYVFYNLNPEDETTFPRFSLPFAGYLLVPDPEAVLIIQEGGGVGVPFALAADADRVTVVEPNPQIADLVRTHYRVPVFHSEGRVFLSRTDRKFDVIQLENWGASLPGSAALSQEHHFTIEAFTHYLEHLTEAGVLILSRKLMLPPSDSVRMWATAYESLRRMGVEEPADHLALLRSWDTYTLIVTAGPLFQGDVAALRTFAEELNFDPVYFPGIDPNEVNRFNIYDEPFHYQRVQQLLAAYRSNSAEAFFEAHMLDVAPQSDHRPFPGRLVKWSRLDDLYRSLGSRVYSLLMSGEIVVGVVFLEALAVAVLLLILPILFVTRGRLMSTPYRFVLYFLGIGAGYMFIEIYFIKSNILLLGDPIISFTVVLSGVLVFSGVGGYLSQYLDLSHLGYALGLLCGMLVVILIGYPVLVDAILGMAPFFRYAVAYIVLLPVGVLMGLPFALGMRFLLVSPVQRAYAWAANGCASVLTSIAAAQVALGIGIPAVMICALAGYLLALVSIYRPTGAKAVYS
ncbi:MAG: hypothetical protein ACOC23_01215 [Thermodesulfobacteriota bacterium]